MANFTKYQIIYNQKLNHFINLNIACDCPDKPPPLTVKQIFKFVSIFKIVNGNLESNSNFKKIKNSNKFIVNN